MGRPWLLYLTAGTVLVIGYWLTPVGDTGRAALYCLIGVSSVVAVLIGVVRFRPTPRLPWLLLGAGQVVYVIAGMTCCLLYDVPDTMDFRTVSDAFVLLRYPFVVTGLVLLARYRTPGRDLPGLLDTGTFAAAVTMLAWVYLIGPRVRGGPGRLGEAVPLLGHPAMDLVLFAVGVKLLLGSGRQPLALFLLMGNLVAVMTADTLYGLQRLNGTYQPGNILDVIWLAGSLALGAAALHPTMARIADQAPAGDVGLGRCRLAVLFGAALVAPVTMLVQYARGITHDIPVIAVAYTLMFLLTIARMTVLLSDQRRLAITDALTGLYTRRFLEAELPIELARVRRTGGLLALFIIDVDHFKAINDHYGHPAGDRVLAEISVRLRGTTRPGDVLARYGGEEFALLAPNVHLDELSVVAERMRTRVAANPITVNADISLFATVSVGACAFPVHVSDQVELVGMADRALYRAKALGRDRTVVWDDVASATAVPGDGPGSAADSREARETRETRETRNAHDIRTTTA
ncbi:diguanylate cyclase [Protofrankia sp. BMG5.30]|uniref:GGDEF domain-containing protein n=1 Tax=Protofrankia sp. BMG5.30 TaxID=1834514 RepID=UPI00138F0602|nr:GGDEF domain-containing protein [Protofrankia sp. BMG5.30]